MILDLDSLLPVERVAADTEGAIKGLEGVRAADAKASSLPGWCAVCRAPGAPVP